MKTIIATGFLALAAGISGLLAQAPPPGQPTVKSKAELEAVQALMTAANAGNPDGIIKAADDLNTKFADTAFKEVALYLEATAYKQKRDNEKAQIYAERVLDVNPKNYQAGLLVGEILVVGTRENDLDKEEKLAKAEKYFNSTIDNLKDAQKPNPQLTDQQWEDGKKYLTAEAHNGLGMVALTRKKNDVAITEFKTAADLDSGEPTYQVRLASALLSAGKNDEAAAVCDKVLANPQLHPQIKQVAQNIKAQATKK